MSNILIVDDDIAMQKVLALQISRKGHQCQRAGTIAEARRLIEHSAFEIIFLDIYLPDGNGLDFLSLTLEESNPPLVIMITGSDQLETVEQAMVIGAWDYLQKPISSSSLNQLLDRAMIVCDQKMVQEICNKRVDNIIGSSRSMIRAINSMLQAARSDVTVLITGPSGTGKELFAHELHRHSQRSSKPFVVVDCAVLPDSLIESILFGHVKGAFTGAVSDRRGLIQQADQGTLFLDEIGELPMEIQKKFLRLLQERTVKPLGARDYIDVDFRLVCATNCNLEVMVNKGLFRTDLFHRINVFPITLSPIHERPEDMALLAHFFNEQLCHQHGCTIKDLSEEFLEAIQRYNWPGNVRELKNVLEMVILTTPETLLYPDHLPINIRAYIIKQNIIQKGSENLLTASEGDGLYNDGVSFFKSWLDKYSGSDIKSMMTIKKMRDDLTGILDQEYLKQLMLFTHGDIQESIKVSGLAKSQLYRLLKKYEINRSVR